MGTTLTIGNIFGESPKIINFTQGVSLVGEIQVFGRPSGSGGSAPRLILSLTDGSSVTERFRIGKVGDTIFSDSSGTETVRIDQSGNVGIGDTSPDFLLDIASGSSASTTLSIDNTSTGDSQILFRNNGVDEWFIGYDDSQSDVFRITDIAFSATNVTGLTIESGGNVGIGTTNPSVALDISGALTVSGLVTITSGSITGITDLAVADGGTGTSSLASGEILLGAGGSPITSTSTLAINIGGTGATTASNARTNLGLVIGTNVQTFGDVLDDFNTLGVAASDGQFIVAIGLGAFAYESGATARTSLGLGLTDSPTFTALTATTTLTINHTNSGDPYINFQDNGTDIWFLGFDNSDANKFRITPGGLFNATSSGITINLAGFVGIGTTNPVSTLEIEAASSAVGTTLTIGNIFGESPKIINFTQGVSLVGEIQVFGRPSGSGGSAPRLILSLTDGSSVTERFRIGKVGDTIFSDSSGTETVRIDQSGNVGIGDTSPDFLLDIASGSSASTTLSIDNTSTGDSQILFRNNGVDEWFIGYDDSQSDVFRITDIAFSATNVTGLTIESGGNVGIGTTNPSVALDISGALTVSGLVTITSGSITGITDLAVADGGTGTSSLASGEILLGAGGSPITSTSTLAINIGGTGATTASNARTNLGLVIGTNVQTFGDVLDDFNTLGVAASDGQFIVAIGLGAFAYESGATARTSLGLGLTDSPTFTALTATTTLTINHTNSGDPYINFQDNGTDIWFLGFDNSDANKFRITPGGLFNATSSGITINLAGFVGIGTTNPSYKLDVQGSTRSTDAFVFSDGSTQAMGATPNGFGWQVTSASFLQATSTAAQTTAAIGLFFKPDGTKMYVVDACCGLEVNEYNLSTPWDVSTALFNQLFDLSTQGPNPRDLFFKPDGTKMYVVDSDDDEVNEYNLSTPWNISTAIFNQRFSVFSQEASPQDVFFKPDGTKMYVLGDTVPDVNEYDLSTPWDISTASSKQDFNVSAQGSDVGGLFFKPDGTKMYVVGGSNDNVNEYDLSAPWDISTASFKQLFNVTTQETAPTGLFLKPDGAKMYVAGVSNSVYEYDLGLIVFGNVGIGTTNPATILMLDDSATPNIYFGDEVCGTSSAFTGISIDTVDPASECNNYTLLGDGTDTYLNAASGGTIYFRDGNDNNVTISATGTVQFSNYGAGTLTTDASGNITASSDERLKDIVGNVETGLAEVLELQGKEWYWNELSGLETSTTYQGFIAQDIEKLIPGVVGITTGGYKTLAYHALLPTFANAIQELNLNLEDIASTTASSTPQSQSFAANFFSNIFNKITDWFADSANGITDFFVGRIHTKEICLGEGDEETCINKDQLDALLRNAVSGGGSGTDPATITPPVVPADTGITTPEVSDTTEPLITLLGDAAVELVVGDTYADEGATASDDTDGDITLNIVVNNTVDTSIVGEYAVTYNVIDAAGNPASEATRFVTVIALPEPPVVSTSTNLVQATSTPPTGSEQESSVQAEIEPGHEIVYSFFPSRL